MLFVKTGGADRAGMFEAEAEGLRELARSHAIRVPRVLAHGCADLAMTRLFGGFGREFYGGYEAAWPLLPGAAARADLYNLHHVLNRLNLFGTGYLERAMRMIDSLLLRANGRSGA